MTSSQSTFLAAPLHVAAPGAETLGSAVLEPAATPASRPSPLAAAFHHLCVLARALRRRDLAFTAALLIADLVFLAMFVGYAYAEHYAMIDSPFYGKLQYSFVDGSYPERYGYAKQALIASLLVAAHRAHRQPIYPALALLFATTLLDDVLTLHERLGKLVAAAGGARLAAAGEPVAWAILGMLPLMVVFAAFVRSDAASRRDAKAVLAGFAVLLFFAVGMDLLHGIVLRRLGHFETALTLVEDGGELVAFTFLSATALAILRLRRLGAPERQAT